MSVWTHYRINAWRARDMGYERDKKITARMIEQDRVSCLRESAYRRAQIKAGLVDPVIARHARYEALLTAYSLRGVWS